MKNENDQKMKMIKNEKMMEKNKKHEHFKNAKWKKQECLI